MMDDYKSHGNDSFWWIDKAEELLISSIILEKAYRSSMAQVRNSEHGVLPNECRTLPIIIYLSVANSVFMHESGFVSLVHFH
jgi:hypothetical protein